MFREVDVLILYDHHYVIKYVVVRMYVQHYYTVYDACICLHISRQQVKKRSNKSFKLFGTPKSGNCQN